ncbi:Putative non-heme bromoperoxidase BpoC [Thermoflexales bacterium]|nr:Putative non-heme bromoperoxidase BpoC [Thermoflexales bacterium]
MPQVASGDITLHYTTHGHGDPLLLIHGGWGLGINGFHFQAKMLASDFRLITPDRRGYGQSTPVSGFNADFHWQHAEDMLKFLDALPLADVRVWGHSDGAIIGAIMAILAPRRVRALVFEGGHLYNRKTESLLQMQQVYADPNSLPEAARVKLAHYHGDDDWPQVIRNWAGAWIELYQRDGDLYHDRLAEIRCPVLIVHGAHDEHTPVSEMEELARRIPQARLVIYPDGGHSLHDQRETRAACTQLVQEFFSAA